MKLNSDGACKSNGELTGCGGIFRQSDGKWIRVLDVKLEHALHIDMRGLYLGIDMT